MVRFGNLDKLGKFEGGGLDKPPSFVIILEETDNPPKKHWKHKGSNPYDNSPVLASRRQLNAL